MKNITALLIATAFLCGSGFFKQNEDGSVGIDTSSLTQKAGEAAKQTEALSQDAIEKIKAAAAKIAVPKEELVSDLALPIDAIKQKVGGMDTAHLVAYLNQYGSVFEDTQAQIANYAQQVKGLKMTEAFGAKGKELKAELAKYTNQLNGLKEQCSIYADALKAYGVDLSAVVPALSSFGM